MNCVMPPLRTTLLEPLTHTLQANPGRPNSESGLRNQAASLAGGRSLSDFTLHAIESFFLNGDKSF